MLPDLIVIVLKVRDYALWLGPPYLIALALGALAQEWGAGWFRQAVPPPEAGPARRAWEAWQYSLAQGLTPTGLLGPLLLNPFLLLLRVGSTLLLGALAAVGVARTPGAPAAAPPPDPPPVPAARPAGVAIRLWRRFRQAVDAELDRFLLGAALGGLIVAWAPGAWLGQQMGNPVLGVGLAVLLGLAVPLNGGAVVPVLTALITRGAGPGAIAALLIAAPLLNWRDLRPLARRLTRRQLAVYIGLTMGGALLLGWTVAQLPGSVRLNGY